MIDGVVRAIPSHLMPEVTSPHFSHAELACPHCGVNGVHVELLDALEEFRSTVGTPVLVDSAYRCPVHNAEIGGAPRSEHVLGMAADIRVSGKSAAELERVARGIPAIKGIGRSTDSSGYIHIDVRPVPAEWTYNSDGKESPYFPA